LNIQKKELPKAQPLFGTLLVLISYHYNKKNIKFNFLLKNLFIYLSKMWSYIFQFMLWWTIITFMSYLWKNIDIKYSALIYAMPIQFTIAVIFIYIWTNKKTIQDLSKSTIISTVIIIIFIICFLLLSKKFSIYTSLIISYIIYIAIWVFFIKYINLK